MSNIAFSASVGEPQKKVLLLTGCEGDGPRLRCAVPVYEHRGCSINPVSASFY